jgi:starch synthase
MRVLLASSEVHPYSKTGGLADMVGALGKSLAAAGHQTGIVTPLYSGIREKYPDLRRLDYWLEVPLGVGRVSAEIWVREPTPGLTIYFVHQPEFYYRKSLYQEAGVDYPDNAARYTFFSLATAHLARYLPWQPEVVHVHDWQTSLVPLLIKHQARRAGWGNAPCSCLTIHNLAYQGLFAKDQYFLANLPAEYFNPTGLEFHSYLNFLKAGIQYADTITTVSPRYAREICTLEFGCGLDGALRGQSNHLTGILNGVDYEEWNTVHNPHLPVSFSVQDLAGKAQAKARLQAELGLPVRPDVPLFGNITRLAEQKGLDILLGALEEMLAADMQFVILGSGSPHLENACLSLARRFRTKVATMVGYNAGLSHRIEAGSDFYLMPSRFEPCGLNQLYSLRYGAVPVVRRTGGLDDSVIDIGDDQENFNGVKFSEYSVRALVKAIRKALVIHSEPELYQAYQTNGMAADFSWDRSTQAYLAVYRQAQARNGAGMD